MSNTPCRAGLLGLACLLGACAGLPPGVERAPADDPAAAVLTLPSGRTATVHPDRLTFSGEATLRWPDGRRYQGSWVEGLPHGQGSETLPDGSRYQGGWQRGRRHGHGQLTEADRQYVGDFVNGAREGDGTLETDDEGSYQGEWAADVPHGQGVFTGEDGSRYEGTWQLGQRFGYGRFAGADGSVYEGDWAYDQLHGFGHLQTADGAAYAGEWQQGRRHGYGRSETPYGLSYEGTWVDGAGQGYGLERRPDGSSYLGDWQAGKRHGLGLELRADGSFHDGTWELNQVLGPGRRRASTGIEISGSWNGDTVTTGLLALPGGPQYAGPLFRRQGTVTEPALLEWLHATAGRGSPHAQLMLGIQYLDMQSPAPDLERARKWLGRAADAGIAEAQYRLAMTYLEVNPPRVVELLAMAGRQAHPQANETLGEYYYGGITVPRNLGRAIGYFQQAVDAGSVSARNNLAWLLATADQPEHRDGRRAVALIRPLALYTGRWQYLDTLAAAWAAAGQFDEAVAAARRALAAAGQEPEAPQPADLASMEARLAGYEQAQDFVEPAP